MSKQQQDAAMSDASTTIDKEPSDSDQLVKKNDGNSNSESLEMKELENSSGISSSGSKEGDNSLHTNVNTIETMLMNKNGKKGPITVYISDGPMKGGGTPNAAALMGNSAQMSANERERETTLSTNSGMKKGNLLQYSEPLVINSRFRTDHHLADNNRNVENLSGTISLRNRNLINNDNRDLNQIDYPPHYQLAYHPNIYSKRSLSATKANEFEQLDKSIITNNNNNVKSNEKRPSHSVVYSNFPSKLIEIPTRQQVYFNNDDQFETRSLDHKQIDKHNQLQNHNAKLVVRSNDNFIVSDPRLDTLLPSNYPRNKRYNPSSTTSFTTSNLSSSLTNLNAPTSISDFRSSANNQNLVKNQQSNVISQLIRVQPSVVKNTSVTYDSN